MERQFDCFSRIKSYEDTLKSVLLASKRLWDKGIGFYLIIKDREPNQKIAEEILSRLIKELDLAIYQLRIRHVYGAISSLIVSADLVISVGSNVSIEGMIANRAVINLLTISEIRVGPSFSGDDGIVEVEGYELPDAMLGLLAISKEKIINSFRHRLLNVMLLTWVFLHSLLHN